ncbi:metal-dependent hydrolase [Natronomonas salina]|uniref:metal-dependent hydrolase n=1 Tax=Natronomonas salina TaxID=1710540 RepID=UPI0015B47E6E|nr:metal-dependent hydrolase [Natronomonas salina]QLD89223.1 metal-dependent hydrolase [Natronomonas salina]
MFPPAHPGVAYLLYSGSRRIVDEEAPTTLATLALVGGAVLPDLIDQPLYHLAGFPTTRTIGHTLLLALPVCLAVARLVRRSSLPQPVGTAFAFGYGAHLAGDALWPLVLGLRDELGFLLWPVTPMPEYEGTKPLVDIGGATVTTLWVELVLLALAVALWWNDGRPGSPV